MTASQSTPNEQGAGGNTPFQAVADLLNQHNGTWGVTEAQARNVLAAIPDGWAKIHGEWVQITSDGVGYGEFDRAHPGRVQMWDQNGTPPGETVWVSPVVHESEDQS